MSTAPAANSGSSIRSRWSGIVVLMPRHDGFGEGALHAGDGDPDGWLPWARSLAIRIVVRRHRAAGEDVRAPRVFRGHRARPIVDRPGWGEVERVLGINAAFDRVTADFDVSWRTRYVVRLRDPDLLLDDVAAYHLFRDGMLDLDTGVHLDEVERAVIDQEFDRARTSRSRSRSKR